MPKHPIQIEELIIKYARGKRLSKQELSELREWQSRSSDHQALPDKFQDLNWLRENLKRLENVPSDRMWDFVREKIALDIQNEPYRTPGHLRRLRQWVPYAAAAIVLAVGWIVLNRHTAARQGKDIPVPVIAKATTPITANHQVLLTLADGSVLPLDHIPNGKITEQGGLILTKTDSNSLVYTLVPGKTETAINSRVTTGHSAPFNLIFPDGSKVLLSYASSLSTSFHAGNREVELTGEAFFETARNAHEPLTVVTKKVEVKVLGTAFNVSSYADEPVAAVSLFNGAVRVERGAESRLLKPHEQVTVTDRQLQVHPFRDSTAVLSWAEKDPYLYFNNADLNTVVRQLARWHQVKVYNPDQVKGIPITGIFRQNESLEATLGMIDRVESGSAFLKRIGDTIEISASEASR